MEGKTTKPRTSLSSTTLPLNKNNNNKRASSIHDRGKAGTPSRTPSHVFPALGSSLYSCPPAKETLERGKTKAQSLMNEREVPVAKEHEETGDARREKSTAAISERLRDPCIPLPLLECIQLIFILYEYCRQRRKRNNKNNIVFSDDNHSQQQRENDDITNELEALINSTEGGGAEGNNNNDNDNNNIPPFLSHANISLYGPSSPGLPFSIFEKFIMEPYFDAFFPPQRDNQTTMESLMDTLNDCGNTNSSCSSKSCNTRDKKSSAWRLMNQARKRARSSYRRRRSSHLEAAENLFCVMDTNGDGFLSWDEFSNYILQTGQRLLLTSEYTYGANNNNNNNNQRGAGEYDVNDRNNNMKRNRNDTSGQTVDYAGRSMNFTAIPTNINIWQQQYPLVRYLYHTEPISKLILANRGRRYITSSWDGLVKIWRPNPRLTDAFGKPSIIHERTIFIAGAPIIDMVLAPDSLGDAEILAVVGMDGTITLLRVGTGEVLKTFVGRWSIPPLAGSRRRLSQNTQLRLQDLNVKNISDNPLLEKDIRRTVEGSAVVLRPNFKIRAYRREALEIFFTEVSRYFIGLDVIAPTYEYLEKRRMVKTDVLLNFGDEVHANKKKERRGSHRSSTSPSLMHTEMGEREEEKEKEKEREGNNNNNNNNNNSTLNDGIRSNNEDTDRSQHEKNKRVEENNKNNNNNNNNESYSDVIPPTPFSTTSSRQQMTAPRPHHHYHDSSNDESNKCWFATSVAFARYESKSSTSVLPSGVFLLLGFETGVLQFYYIHPRLFTISNLSMTRLEVPSMHEPVLTLKLHYKTITNILTSELQDLLLTTSDDGTVVVRHMTRIRVPFLTLGDGIKKYMQSHSVYFSGHSKRITCVCWHSVRNLIITGGADQCVIFWSTSSLRHLHRIDLRVYSTSSCITGTPIDASFMQPPRYPLLVLVLDTRRVLYFFDTISYQCLHILRDDSFASLKCGEMLRVRYDAVDNRLILGGKHIRCWDIRQGDEYPADYCGHRRSIVGLLYQQSLNYWITADDSVIIIWRIYIAYDERSRENKKNDDEGKEKEKEEKEKEEDENNTKPKLKLSSRILRTWCVEGGICCIDVEQTESSHIFVALLRERRIVEYNSFSGSVLRSFGFPSHMGEISSLSCGKCKNNIKLLHSMDFLCGTFEQEHSLNGITALYTLSSGSDIIPLSAECQKNSNSIRRSIVTSGVGVSCGIIVPSLGLVVVGHRGGISITPIEEATTCPIPCVRLTDIRTKKKEKLKRGKSLKRKTTPEPVRASTPTPARAPTSIISTGGEEELRESESKELKEGGMTAVCSRSSRNSVANASNRRSFLMSNMQKNGKGNCRPSPPLDLVALFPGPLIQDPVPITRECMQQRERYLFYEEERKKHATPVTRSPLTSVDVVGGGGTEDDGGDNNDNKDPSKNEKLPPLLLFSEDFISSCSALGGNFSLFLREQLATLGYVGHIVPLGETGYGVSGSDDGVVQFWNFRTLSEVMRCRVTYALDAVTAMDVSEDVSQLAVGDSNGYILLLDIHRVEWDSPVVPLEIVPEVEKGVRVLRRWRGHQQSVTSVQFVQRDDVSASRGNTPQSGRTYRPSLRGMSYSSRASQPKSDSSNARNASFGVSGGRGESRCSHGDSKHDVVFLCSSSEDSYVYAWCWEAEPCVGGTVHCIGCFGGGVESPPMPLSMKLTESVFQVLELVRRAYIEEQLLSPGGVLDGIVNVQDAIHAAVREIMEDMKSVKAGGVLAKSHGMQVVKTTTTLSIGERKRFASMQQQSRMHDINHSHLHTCPPPISLKKQQCPPSYVFAFEEGLYYDRDLAELLGRMVTEMRCTTMKRKQSMADGFSECKSCVGEKQAATPTTTTTAAAAAGFLPSPSVVPTEKCYTTGEESHRPTFPTITPNTGKNNVAVTTTTTTTTTKTAAAPTTLVAPEGIKVPSSLSQKNHNNNNSNQTGSTLPTKPCMRPSFHEVPSREDADTATTTKSTTITTATPSSSSSSGGGGGGVRTQQRATGTDTFSFPDYTAANMGSVNITKPSALEETFASPTTATLLAVARPDSPFSNVNENGRTPLPPVTVSFAASALPRLRPGAKKNIERNIKHNAQMDSLPVISDIVGCVAHGKLGESPKRFRGTKILVKEKTKRVPFHSMFLNNVRNQSVSVGKCSVGSGSPEQMSVARRERKRHSVVWSPQRIMNTLMTWKAPRISSASTRTVSSSTGSDMSRPGSSESMRETPFKLPMFIPPNLGTTHTFPSFSTMQETQGKSVVMMLKNEMEAMKATLKATLQEKQVLLAQERAAQAAANAVSGGGGGGRPSIYSK